MHLRSKLPVVRLVLAILACVLCGSFPAFSQMRKVHKNASSYPTNDVRKLSFLSGSQGYVTFTNYIGYTADSGRTFTPKEITLNNVDFNNYEVNVTFGFVPWGVKALSKDTILAYGNYGLVPAILYSVNGGNTFKLVFHGGTSSGFSEGFKDMVFAGNSATGFAIDRDRIVRSLDRGRSWSELWPIPKTNLDHLQAIDATTYIAFGQGQPANTKLLMSTDAGQTWEQRPLPDGRLYCAYFLTKLKGWARINSTDGTLIYYTADGARTWKPLNTNTGINLTYMQFVDDSTGFGITNDYNVYKTTDGGKMWERLLHDTDYYSDIESHQDLQCISKTQLWAGGTLGFLELSTNAGGPTIPQPYFNVDTTNSYLNNVVRLSNFGKTSYIYEWFKNDTLVGNGYHATYSHNKFHPTDTIKLVAHNGGLTDTAVEYVQFPLPVIVTSFSPAIAKAGDAVTIKGLRFYNTYNVFFGGVPAASFQLIDNNTIRAVPSANGASGHIMVNAQYGRDSLPGFTFLPAPVINGFSPQTDTVGSTIEIRGKHFSSAAAVSFGGVPADNFTILSDSVITAVVGSGETGNITIRNNGGSAEISGFNIRPVIRDFSPKIGTGGEMIEITGTGFGKTSYVAAGYEHAISFEINSPTSITAILGEAMTGKIAVVTQGGRAEKDGFIAIQPPVITGFTPVSGPVGTTVTISGKDFSTVAEENTVYFGSVKANVTAATATSLTVTVPVGAMYCPLTVSKDGLTAYSSMQFNVTFPGAGSITGTTFDPRVDMIVRSTGQNTRWGYVMQPIDIDGDGKTDALINDKNKLVLLRNTTTGDSITFAAPQVLVTLSSEWSSVAGIQVADINGDGKTDIFYNENYWEYVLINRSTPGAISVDPPVTIRGWPNKVWDLDGDGKTDIIGSGAVNRNLSNRDTIRFGWEKEVDIYLTLGAVGDLDGDGKADAVASTSEGIYVSKNISTKGVIQFEKERIYSSTGALSMAIGDVDNDGKNDIAIAEGNGAYITILRNISNTSQLAFAEAIKLKSGATPADLHFSDIDGDNRLDLIYVNTSAAPDAKLNVMKNISLIGQIRFADRVTYENSRQATSLIVADLNGDSKPDAITFGNGDGIMSIFRNRAAAQPFLNSFTPGFGEKGTVVHLSGERFTGVTAVLFGSSPAQSFTVDSDTAITAIVGEGSTGIVSVSNSYGASSAGGEFVYGVAPVIHSIQPMTGPVGSSVVISGNNFSEDPAANRVLFGSAQAKVISASTTSLTVEVPTGTDHSPVSVTTDHLTAASPLPFVTTYPVADNSLFAFTERTDVAYAYVRASADLNNDNKPELIAGKTDSLVILVNTSIPGKASFTRKAYYSPVEAYLFRPADIDGDGKTDILAIAGGSEDFLVHLNTSNGSEFSLKTVIIANGDMPIKASTYDADITDIDGDGKPDLTIINYDSKSFAIYRNISTPGHPAFALRQEYFIPEGYPTAVIVRDMDRDGAADLVLGTTSPDLRIYRNISSKGHFAFAAPVSVQQLPATAGIGQLAVGDLNGDGQPDLMMEGSGGVYVSQNNSSNNLFDFTAPDFYRMPYEYGTIDQAILSDLNGDGKPEIVAVHDSWSYGTRGMSVFRNITSPFGTIHFDPPKLLPAADSAYGQVVTDIDSDGRQDLVAYVIGERTAIMLNQLSDTIGKTLCLNAPATLTANISGQRYQWQQNSGNGFVNISDNADFSGTTTATLQLSRVQSSWQDNQFRCVADEQYSIRFVISVTTPLVPSVTISTNRDTICAGRTAIFTAHAVNGGSKPIYTWLINGVSTGKGQDRFSGDSLRNNDQVSVIMNSSETCVSAPADTSESIAITVRNLAPSIVSTDSSFTVVNFGSLYRTNFEWQYYSSGYWQDVSVSSTTPTYKPKRSGNYRVIVAQDSCSWISEILPFAVPDTTSPSGRLDLHLYPNPVSTTLTINKLQLSDEWEKLFITSLDGSQQLGSYDVQGRTTITVNIVSLQKGIYLAVLKRKKGKPVSIRFMKL